jgi:hypothetical protein
MNIKIKHLVGVFHIWVFLYLCSIIINKISHPEFIYHYNIQTICIMIILFLVFLYSKFIKRIFFKFFT